MKFASAVNTEVIEQYLIRKKQELSDELVELSLDDPVFLPSQATSEVGDSSWEADVHAKSVTVKSHLLSLLGELNRTLDKLRNGAYGQCVSCGRRIDKERLKAIPLTSHCRVCA